MQIGDVVCEKSNLKRCGVIVAESKYFGYSGYWRNGFEVLWEDTNFLVNCVPTDLILKKNVCEARRLIKACRNCK